MCQGKNAFLKKTIGFDPQRFRHGIGRNAFTHLDDSQLKDQSPHVSSNTRVIGISGLETPKGALLW
jgi:hypothetical protein